VNSGEWINLISIVPGPNRTGPDQNGWVGSGLVQKRKKKKISYGSSRPTSCPIYSGLI
jgi:hypothetical protein